MWGVLFHALSILVLSLVFALDLLRGGRSRWEWWTGLALVIAVTSWSFVVGRWDIVGYYIRFVLPVLTLAVALFAWRRTRRNVRDLPRGGAGSFSVVLNVVLTLIIGAQAVLGVAGFSITKPAVELEFPLQNGTYYVIQGGRTTLINYHAAYAAQAYALDISRLNMFGYRAAGIYPAALPKYTIFGEPVYSPCTGEVIVARDGLPDHTPPVSDPHRPEGNFVVIRCQGIDVVLAHLQEHSVLVSEGELVEAGQLLGRVGNSGNTTEPHLHIHAERWSASSDGTEEKVGVPIRFNGRFLGRNSIVRAR